jgi:benzoyl-CoA reductase/2-hydroxyglutaryl-CoA dehydratase subunit BcrC/BadD/HgdB
MVGKYSKKIYAEAVEAKEQGKPVIWIHLAGIIDLIRAFDVASLAPENNAAACAATGIAPKLIEVSTEKWGFDRSLCSYFTINFGFAAEGRNWQGVKFPSGGLTMPDLLIGDCLSCIHRVGWWRWLEKILKVPTFIFDGPLFAQGMDFTKPDPSVIGYMVSQMRETITFMEEHTGQKFDLDRFREVLRKSEKATKLAYEISTLCGETIPAPAGVEDFAHWLFALNVLRGTQDSVDFLQTAYNEVQARTANKQAMVPEERYRLFVSGNLPYYALGILSYVHRYGAACVGDWLYRVFCNPEIPFDYEKPLESYAQHILGYALNWSYEKNWQYHEKTLKDYGIDGIIFFVQKGCKVVSGPLWHARNMAEKVFGLPTIIFELEQADPGDYSPVQVAGRLDAFMEVVATRKEARR